MIKPYLFWSNTPDCPLLKMSGKVAEGCYPQPPIFNYYINNQNVHPHVTILALMSTSCFHHSCQETRIHHHSIISHNAQITDKGQERN